MFWKGSTTRLLASTLLLLAVIITGYTVDSADEDYSIYANSETCEKNYGAACGNGDCIPKTKLCNGKKDCTDGSDELGCSPLGCGLREFRCANKQCVHISTRCDGAKDCADGSDEENCAPLRPGTPCKYHEFECASGDECIPGNYHCDMISHCRDGSDELGCVKVSIQRPPPAEVEISVGETFAITCIAVGIPVPEINWQFNSDDIPAKCKTTSVNGIGNMTCPNITSEDLGVYTCVAMNKAFNYYSFKWNLALHRTTLVRKGPLTKCPEEQFNSIAHAPKECTSCFCSGIAKNCSTAGLFVNELRTPFDQFNTVDVEDLTILGPSNRRQYFFPIGKNGVLVADHSNDDGRSSIAPFFALPDSYRGNQLKSYGGYLTYRVLHTGRGKLLNGGFSVIISGNNYVLGHEDDGIEWETETEQRVQFFVGQWKRVTEDKRVVLASREEIMMTLANIDNILLKIKYGDGVILTTITNVAMDSADQRDVDLGHAWFVEKCDCPNGYAGLSCERCAPGFKRRDSGSWPGQCYEETPLKCPPGTYGDPSRSIPCQTCPCPLSLPSNQFAKTCRLGSDGQPDCDCAQGYVGRNCEKCAPGYEGNPLVANEKCIYAQGASTAVSYQLGTIVGGSAQLPCNAEKGIPNSELTWTREDGKPILSNVKKLPDGTLKISNATLENEGVFVCSASNNVGFIFARIILEVNSRPLITMVPSNQSPHVVKSGDRVQLTCNATGQPHPSVTWSRRSIDSAPSKALTSDAVYEISSVSLEDAGFYTCNATNSVGTAEKRIQVIVKDNTIITKAPTQDGHENRIPAQKISVPVGAERIQIRCQITETDIKNYLDVKRSDGKSLPEGSSVRDNILFLPRTTCEMAGKYVCQETSVNGSVKNAATIQLDITGCKTESSWWWFLG